MVDAGYGRCRINRYESLKNACGNASHEWTKRLNRAWRMKRMSRMERSIRSLRRKMRRMRRMRRMRGIRGMRKMSKTRLRMNKMRPG